MTGTMQNREAFLNKIAKNLGRERITEGVKRPQYKYQPQHEVLKGATAEELVVILKEQCTRIHTDFYTTDNKGLAATLKQIVADYGGGPVLTTKDARFEEFGLTELLSNTWPAEDYEVFEWDPKLGDGNIPIAERSNIGITFSEITLAESGTVVLFSDNDKGRSVSLLPRIYIAIIPKSTLVPRMTQASQIIRGKLQSGEALASCINFVTGPSNSADIELNLVVGVHGPVKAAYIVVDDK